MPPPPDVTVAALAERQGRFLLVEERIARRVVFNQPAGHVERGETLLQAVAGETAWRFTGEAFLGAYLWKHPGTGRSSLRFTFIGSVSDHDALQPLDHGILRTHWLTRAQVLEQVARLRSPLVLRCIDDYLAGQRQPLLAVGHLDMDGARDVPAVEVA